LPQAKLNAAAASPRPLGSSLRAEPNVTDPLYKEKRFFQPTSRTARVRLGGAPCQANIESGMSGSTPSSANRAK
jgi:hypothetical protein